MDRFGGHWTDIGKAQLTDIGKHFTSKNHNGGSDMEIHILDFIHAHPKSEFGSALRDKIEFHWIQRLRTQLPMGLNAMDKPPDTQAVCRNWQNAHKI